MQQRSVLTAGAVISAVIGALVGNFIKGLPESMSLSELVGTIFIIIGVLTILSSIPGLLYGMTSSSTVSGKVSFVLSLINLIFGLTLIFYHSDILLLATATYLVVFPILQIFLAKGSEMKKRAARALVPKIVLGVLVILFFNILSGAAETIFSITLKCVGWGLIALSGVFLLTVFFLLYIRPLFVSKKKTCENTIYLDDDDFRDRQK